MLEATVPTPQIDRPEPAKIAAARAKFNEYDAQIREREADIQAAEARRDEAKAILEIAKIRGDVIGQGEAEAVIIEAEQAISVARSYVARTTPLRSAQIAAFSAWDAEVRSHRRLLLEIEMIDEVHAPRLRAVDALRGLLHETGARWAALIEEWNVGIADHKPKLYSELGRMLSPGSTRYNNAEAAVSRRRDLVAAASDMERHLWPR